MWIDVITQPGLTFRFDPARGYLPLLEDRPTIVIPASGSDFVTGMNRGRIDVATPSSASTTCVLSRSGRRPDPLSRSGPRVKARTAASSTGRRILTVCPHAHELAQAAREIYGRRHLLTDEGDLLLSYAKSILRLHDEMLQRLASPDVEGTVVLGTPDLYAAFVLPAILNRFRKAFPRVQVELRCELSTPLVGLVRRGEIDLVLVTKMEGFSGGKVVGQEQLIWMVGADSDAHWLDPVPLAVLAARHIYPEHAIGQLEPIRRELEVH